MVLSVSPICPNHWEMSDTENMNVQIWASDRSTRGLAARADGVALLAAANVYRIKYGKPTQKRVGLSKLDDCGRILVAFPNFS
jgi:hypothetical protein